MAYLLRATSTTLLLTCLAAATACADDVDDTERARIDFRASVPAFDTLEVDSGPQPVAEGVVMRTVTTFDAFWEVEASGTARGAGIEPIAGTGEVSVRGVAQVEVFATVTLPGYEFDGLVGTRTAELESGLASFDPFALDEPRLLGFDIPNEIQLRLDPVGGVGLAYVVEMSLTYLPTYEGLCLAVDEDAQAAQYTGMLQPVADFKYVHAVELVTPLGNDRLGALGLDVDTGQAVGLELDLGTYSMDDGEPVASSMPCG